MLYQLPPPGHRPAVIPGQTSLCDASLIEAAMSNRDSLSQHGRAVLAGVFARHKRGCELRDDERRALFQIIGRGRVAA